MKRIGLLSDTHGYWDDRYAIHFKDCDEIWHAGDIGSAEICNKLREGKLFRSVYGNIDGQDIRIKRQKILSFTCENVRLS